MSEQLVENLMILCVYITEFSAILALTGLIWWLADLWLAHVARQQRRTERRARNRKLAA
jgi:hypothetical protein